MQDILTSGNHSNSSSRGLGGYTGRVHLSDAGKRFNRDWIFRHLTYTFETGRAYAITGPNGSGKSTLLQAIAGSMQLSEGSLAYGMVDTQVPVEPENFYRSLSIAAPYLDLVEEMTAEEFLAFHEKFKPFLPAIDIQEILSTIGLEKAAKKQIRYFSSGMKQRLKLAQAVFSDMPVLLLDEPCTNLDTTGYSLYHDLLSRYCAQKLIIVCSNEEQEIGFCDTRLAIMDYK